MSKLREIIRKVIKEEIDPIKDLITAISPKVKIVNRSNETIYNLPKSDFTSVTDQKDVLKRVKKLNKLATGIIVQQNLIITIPK